MLYQETIDVKNYESPASGIYKEMDTVGLDETLKYQMISEIELTTLNTDEGAF